VGLGGRALQAAVVSEERRYPPLPDLSSLEVDEFSLKNLVSEVENKKILLRHELEGLGELSSPKGLEKPARLVEIDHEISLVQTEISLLETQKKDKIFQIQKGLESLKTKKRSLEDNSRKIRDLNSLISSKSGELSHLTDKTCPFCMQNWSSTEAEAKIRSIKGDLESYNSKIETYTTIFFNKISYG